LRILSVLISPPSHCLHARQGARGQLRRSQQARLIITDNRPRPATFAGGLVGNPSPRGAVERPTPRFRYARLVSKTPFHVVIAEDEALIRLDLREMLEEEGYVVAGEAADGETAVQLAEDLRPDLVIMDVKMPGLDGISAAERITATQLAPVVILTAFSQRDLVQRASEAGAMAYLIKPFTKADLVPAIEVAASRFAEIAALNAEAAGLRERLEVRKLLDRAKGHLQDDRGMTEAQAFRWIQKTSMDRRQTMRAVAEQVLAEAEAEKAKAAEPVTPDADKTDTPEP
jgi:two-component system, response regulator PdtaR